MRMHHDSETLSQRRSWQQRQGRRQPRQRRRWCWQGPQRHRQQQQRRPLRLQQQQRRCCWTERCWWAVQEGRSRRRCCQLRSCRVRLPLQRQGQQRQQRLSRLVPVLRPCRHQNERQSCCCLYLPLPLLPKAQPDTVFVDPATAPAAPAPAAAPCPSTVDLAPSDQRELLWKATKWARLLCRGLGLLEGYKGWVGVRGCTIQLFVLCTAQALGLQGHTGGALEETKPWGG